MSDERNINEGELFDWFETSNVYTKTPNIDLASQNPEKAGIVSAKFDRAQETKKQLTEVRDTIKILGEDFQLDRGTESKALKEVLDRQIKSDIDSYLATAVSNPRFATFKKIWKSKGARWTKIGVGIGLSTAAVIAAASGAFGVALGALLIKSGISAIGSWMTTKEAGELSLIHKQTTRSDLSITEKFFGFFKKDRVAIKEDDVAKMSDRGAQISLAKTLAAIKETGAGDLSAHRQREALELLVNHSSSNADKRLERYQLKRREQLKRALRNRLAMRSLTDEELNQLVTYRVSKRADKLIFGAKIAERAQDSEQWANNQKKQIDQRAKATAFGMGLFTFITGVNKTDVAQDLANWGEDLSGFWSKVKEGWTSVFGEETELVKSVIATDNVQPVIPEIDSTPTPEIEDRGIPSPEAFSNLSLQAETSMSSILDQAAEDLRGIISEGEEAMKEILPTFDGQFNAEQIEALYNKILESDILEEKFGHLNGENLASKLNLATKLHRGDLEISDINHDAFGNQHVTLFDDGKNAMGAQVAEARNIEITLDGNGDIIDAEIVKPKTSIMDYFTPEETPEFDPVPTSIDTSGTYNAPVELEEPIEYSDPAILDPNYCAPEPQPIELEIPEETEMPEEGGALEEPTLSGEATEEVRIFETAPEAPADPEVKLDSVEPEEAVKIVEIDEELDAPEMESEAEGLDKTSQDVVESPDNQDKDIIEKQPAVIEDPSEQIKIEDVNDGIDPAEAPVIKISDAEEASDADPVEDDSLDPKTPSDETGAEEVEGDVFVSPAGSI